MAVAVGEAYKRPRSGRPSVQHVCAQEASEGSRHSAGPHRPGGTYRFYPVWRCGRFTDLHFQYNGKEVVWAPHKTWSAWPLTEGLLPKDDLVARQEDEDEEFTFRNRDIKMPSSDLQDELSAIILRMAKKKFRKRQRRWAGSQSKRRRVGSAAAEEGQQSGSEAESRETSPAKSKATSAPPQSGDDSEGTATEDDQSEPADENDIYGLGTRRTGRRPHQTYKPTISTNDELSYKLLEPSSRHILSQLDSTLRILQQTRGIVHRNRGSSTTDKEPDSQQGTPGRRLRSGPRRLPVRPKAEGNSFEALIKKERGADSEDEEPDAGGAHTGAEGSDNGGNEPEGDGPDASGTEPEGEGRSSKKRRSQGPKTAPWGIRDWSSVIGAASLAGFSQDVIGRTTKRCADLFGESMTIRTLDEVPASTGTGVHTVDYHPEPIHLSASDLDSDDPIPSSDYDAEINLLHRRIAARQSSEANWFPPSPSSRAYEKGPFKRRYYCPFHTCKGAAEGFTRTYNLRRHLERAHDGEAPGGLSSELSEGRSGASEVDSEVDSENEMLGAVHVDGFLRVMVKRNWRGARTNTTRNCGRGKKRRNEDDNWDTGEEVSGGDVPG